MLGVEPINSQDDNCHLVRSYEHEVQSFASAMKPVWYVAGLFDLAEQHRYKRVCGISEWDSIKHPQAAVFDIPFYCAVTRYSANRTWVFVSNTTI
jgi:hypothetical protein